MNQADLIDRVASVSGESKKTVKHVLDTAGDVVTEVLSDGSEAVLPGLGKLHVKQSAARTGRNPQTGETMQIAAKNAVKFSAIKALKDAVNK